MVIQLLQQKNECKKNIIAVLLCAGEGLRLKEITSKIPKSLIKIKCLDELSILEHTILNLIKLGIERIYIITGHLGDKIKKFITSFKKTNRDFEEKLFVIDSEGQYKRGPLYSLLSITKNKNFFKKKCVYVVMPGDTIFQLELLTHIITFLLNNFKTFQENPAMFYRRISVNALKTIQISEMISTADIEKKHHQYVLKKIRKQDLKTLSDSDYVRQVVPISIFPYNFLISLLEHVKHVQVKTISQIINNMITRDYNVIAVKISNEHQFFDIDTKSDLNNFLGFNKNKKEGKG